MAYVFWTIIKKRWYVFGIMGLFTFITTVLSWNNTNLLFTQLPYIIQLHEKSSTDVYEIMVFPHAESDGLIITNTSSERQQFIGLLETTFFSNKSVDKLYRDKQGYLEGDKGLAEMPKLEQSELSQMLAGHIFQPEFFDDLLVANTSPEHLKQAELLAEKLRINLMFTSLKKRFQSELRYYGGGALFALLVNVLASGFGLLLIYWLIHSLFIICQEDIRLLRIIGLSKSQLHRYLLLLVLSAPMFGIFLSLLFIHSISVGRTILIWDYIYLFSYQFLIGLIISKLIKNQLRRFLDA
ncbi:hypothetical protein ACVRZR_09080 [Streptococcus entericus]|uniref:hypothetical protein n=1 Tax=Streptococcus entericus TaxID=155680 RepID=UPI0003797DC1|nr:hypothetical protein [Streptococcus entericus]